MIKDILENYKETRDDDLLLYKKYLIQEIGIKVLDFSVSYLFEILSTADVRSFESVARIRRKLQEQYIHLRGKSYSKRQKMAEDFKLELF